MYCSFCGQDTTKAQKYCRSCGSYLMIGHIMKTGRGLEVWSGAISSHASGSLLIWWFIQIGSNLAILILTRKLENADLGMLRFLAVARVPFFVVLAAIFLTALTCAYLLRLATRRSTSARTQMAGPSQDQATTRLLKPRSDELSTQRGRR